MFPRLRFRIISSILFATLAIWPVARASAENPPPHLRPPAGVSAAEFQRIYSDGANLQLVFRSIYEAVRPSVVSVMAPGARGQASVGTGFVIDANGLIVTNLHVVGGARSVQVIFYDNRRVPGTVLGLNRAMDIAVIKITGVSGLKPAVIGDSDRVQVGDIAIALGSPYGLPSTFTTGVISAVGRRLDESRLPLIQTDAAINQGNSGGPLLNLRGEVIGINQQIISQSGGSIGIGLAIPINAVRPLMEQAMRGGATSGGGPATPTNSRAVLGVRVDPSPNGGAVVVQVLANSGAQRAGIRPGDIIVKIDSTEIREAEDLLRYVQNKRAGDRVTLEAVRGAARIRAEAKLSTIE